VNSFVRHQLGSIVATVVDFSVMIVLRSLFGFWPAVATAFGAGAGGFTNFFLGRFWIFHDGGDARASAREQGVRYAVVSGGSLVLNALGEHLLATVWGIQYVAARVVVAVLVSVAWNYPMQKSFVFRVGAR
jgi:putative flippase GtrA